MKYFCLLIIFVILFLNSCSKKPASASYHYVQKQVQHGDLSFHKQIRLHEYLNAFDQPWLDELPGDWLVVGFHTLSQSNATNTGNFLQWVIRTPKAPDSLIDKTKSISMVVDISGSMLNYNKFFDAQSALVSLVNELKVGDHFSLTIFNQNAVIAVHPTPINDETKPIILEKISNLSPGGGTNIEEGLLLGYQTLGKFDGDGIKKLVLITDGISPVSLNSMQEISSKSQTPIIKGANISTIGLGIDVDQAVLRKIATIGNGHFYFAESGDELSKIFTDEMNSFALKYVDSMHVQIEAATVLENANFYGSDSVRMGNSTVSLSFGSLNYDEGRIIVAELPDGYTGNYQKDFFLSLRLKNDNDWETVQYVTVPKRVYSITNGINWTVARNSVIFGNAQAIKKVGELAEDRQYDPAADILEAQVANNYFLLNGPDTLGIGQEIKTLSAIQIELINRINQNTGKYQVSQINEGPKEPTIWGTVLRTGLEVGIESLPGPWKTLAEIFLVVKDVVSK